MDAQHAKHLVSEYIEGWRANDKTRILSVIAEECVVIESHGPTFLGKQEIARWLDDWIKQGSRVTKWDVSSFTYEKSIAAAEWVFACECLGVHYEIIGASIFRFSDEVISRVTEYRSTKETEANQALEHNDPSRHTGCCAPVAPAGVVAHL